RAVQAVALAFRAGPVGDVLAQLLAHRLRIGLAVSALEVVHDALERVAAPAAAAGGGDVGEGNGLAAGAVQHRMPGAFAEPVPRRVHVEAVVLCQGVDELEVVRVAAVPAAHGPAGQAQVRMGDDAVRIEELRHAQTVAGGTGADR